MSVTILDGVGLYEAANTFTQKLKKSIQFNYKAFLDFYGADKNIIIISADLSYKKQQSFVNTLKSQGYTVDPVMPYNYVRNNFLNILPRLSFLLGSLYAKEVKDINIITGAPELIDCLSELKKKSLLNKVAWFRSISQPRFQIDYENLDDIFEALTGVQFTPPNELFDSILN